MSLSSRRDFLRVGSLAIGGLTLGDFLHHQALPQGRVDPQKIGEDTTQIYPGLRTL